MLVIGGGFAGIRAALAAKRLAGDRLSVALVSRDAYTVIRPRLYEANPSTLVADIEEPLTRAGVTLIIGDVVSVDPQGAYLTDGRLLPFRSCVFASGSVMAAPSVDGLEHVHSIDDLPSAMSLDRRLAHIATLVAPTLIVVGAGFTGLELALELRDRLAVHGAGAAAEAARIVLLDRGAVGAELGPSLKPVINAVLAADRIECMPDVVIDRFVAEGILLADGMLVGSDCTVVCTGLRAALPELGFRGARDAFGRLVLGPTLTVGVDAGIYAAGDAGVAECSPGVSTLMSCQHALATGPVAGENAARELLGLEPLIFRQSRYVTCLDLGRYGAAFTEGRERHLLEVGPGAKAIKHRINRSLIYPPTGD